MKAGYCVVRRLFFVPSALSKTAGFYEQAVKSLGFFLYRTVVQLKRERKKEKFIFPHISRSVSPLTVSIELDIF